MISTREEIKNNVLLTTQQDETQIGTMVESFINLTLREIESPGWAFAPKREIHHRWGFLKRKQTITTVSGTSEYVLGRDIKDIAFMRQTETPCKLLRMTDEDFYKREPNPTATGNPRIYRVWELSGVATKLGAADTIDVVSDSASDDGDADLTVTVWGYVGGILQSEVYTLDGITTVSGSTTFDADQIFVSKSKDTAGIVTITENSGGTTLTTMGKEERNPLHKVVTFHPIPSSAITVYVEGYGYMKELVNQGDVPPFGPQWHYIVRLGTLAKVYQHLGKETDFAMTHGLYAAGVRAMVFADRGTSDLIQHLDRHNRPGYENYYVRRSTNDVV